MLLKINKYGAALDTIKGEFEKDIFADESFKDLINYAKFNNNLTITPHILDLLLMLGMKLKPL